MPGKVEITSMFQNLMTSVLSSRAIQESQEAMRKGMRDVERLAKREVDTEGLWNPPGLYESEGGFKWQATGLAKESITGYEIHKAPENEYQASIPDAYGRIHRTDATVAPIPAEKGNLAIGVLTMTAAYAPESGDEYTEEFKGERHGLQYWEKQGSPAGSVKAMGEPITVRALEKFKGELENAISSHLKLELK